MVLLVFLIADLSLPCIYIFEKVTVFAYCKCKLCLRDRYIDFVV